MSVRDYPHLNRCVLCTTRHRRVTLRVLAYYQSRGGFKTIYRLCWRHAEPLIQLLREQGVREP